MDDLLQTDDIETLRRLAITAWKRAESLTEVAADATRKASTATQQKDVVAAKLSVVESEVQVLLARIAELTTRLAEATQRDVQMELELELRTLREQLADSAAEKFGMSKSERRPRGKTAKAKAKQSGHGPTKQPKIPHLDEFHFLDEGCDCPSCGSDLRVMGECFEESELIASVRRSFVMKEVKRAKYACVQCGDIQTAPGPLKLIPGGRYDLSFTVAVAIDKYLDALPLERQVRRMNRVDLTVTSQTLWDQLDALYAVLLPTLVALHASVLTKPLLHVDESSWRMMGKGRTKKWWLWTLVSSAGTYFQLLPSRGSAAACSVFSGYTGTVMADGYVVYGSLEKALDKLGPTLELGEHTLPVPDYSLALCWMHARRPLIKAEKHGSDVGQVLDWIGELYAIEAEAARLAAGDEEVLLDHRRRLRAEKSQGIIDKIGHWRDSQRVLPKTQHAKGVAFLKKYWRPLTRFLSDPLIPLDNGEAERKIRGPVVGRKNYYGVRSAQGAAVASLFFSLITTCTQLGVDPHEYLMEAAQRAMQDRGSVYLPSQHLAEKLRAGAE